MSLQHILLGLLKDTPSSGYDLNKRLQLEVQHFWITDQSQIYRALYKMQEEGWVDFEVVFQADSPNKKVYHLTESGDLELNTWLRGAQSENQLSSHWLARLYFSDALSQDEVHILLNKRLNSAYQFQNKLEAQLSKATSKNQRLTLQYSLDILNTEITWLKATLESLSP